MREEKRGVSWLIKRGWLRKGGCWLVKSGFEIFEFGLFFSLVLFLFFNDDRTFSGRER